jgi:hypothetical protein
MGGRGVGAGVGAGVRGPEKKEDLEERVLNGRQVTEVIDRKVKIMREDMEIE